jgi:hypothetical protein
MKRLVAAMVMTLAIAGPAHATDWWVYVAQSDQCELATRYALTLNMPAVRTPGDFQDAMRAEGLIPETKILRDDHQQIQSVSIILRNGNSQISVEYFPTQLLCFAFQATVEKYGGNAPPQQLH